MAAALLAVLGATDAHAEPRKQYWATSLTRTVDDNLLRGLREAVAHGDVGWLDVVRRAIPAMAPGVNLILYHVGGNCRIGRDCDRFPASLPTTDGWGDKERMVDLNDPQTRKIVVADLVDLMQQADRVAPQGSVIGVHVDNIHRLDADGLGRLFNEYLQAVETAKQQGLIARARRTGYIAKNNPAGFRRALEQRLLDAAPFYLINENASLTRDGMLDRGSRVAQQLGQRYGLPVFLKTFGTDVAYTAEQNGKPVPVAVSPEMTRQMAQLPDISGAAWSPDERQYQPTLFAQGGPLREAASPYVNRIDD